MVKLHGAVLPSLTGFPVSPVEGRIAFVNDVLYVFTDVDGINSWYPMTNRTKRHIHNQGTTSSSWVISHTLNSTDLIVICYDDSDNLLTPSNITYDTADQITVTLGTPSTGNCAIFIDVAEELSFVADTTDKISEGNSSLEVIDTGTGEVKALLDTEDVFDLTNAIQRIGKDVDTNIKINQTTNIIDLDANDGFNFLGGAVGEIEFKVAANGDLTVENTNHGGSIIFQGEETGTGADKVMLEMSPDNSVDLYNNGVKTAFTNAWGITIEDSVYPSFGFHNTDGDITDFIYSNVDEFIISSERPESPVEIRAKDTGDVSRLCADFYGDHRVALYHAGGKAFSTFDDGIVVWDKDGNDPTIGFQNSAGSVYGYFLCGQGSNDSIYLQNKINDGDMWLNPRDSGGTSMWAGLDSGTPAFVPSPSNTISLGRSNNVWKDVWATDTSINTSDSRLKTVLGDSLGLDFIDRLNTVTYRWNDGTRPHQGVIAQEVKTVMDTLGIDFAGYIDPYISDYPGGWTPPPDPDPDPDKAVPETGETEPMLGMRYSEFVAPLIKSVQELSTLASAQQTVIDDLTSRIEVLEAV